MKALALLPALAAITSSCGTPAAPASSPQRSPLPPATVYPSASGPASPSAPGVAAPHVAVIVMENRSYGQVIGSAEAPASTALAARYGLATASYGVAHPSLPNYLAILAGSTFGITSDCTSCSIGRTPTFATQLDGVQVPWRAYMEGMPSPCYAGASGGDGYAKKHDPFAYSTTIMTSAQDCARIVPFSGTTGLDTGPAAPFVWISPNLCDDGHDCSTRHVDAWLSSEVSAIQASAWYRQNGIIIVTWDEGVDDAGCCGDASGGHIATLVISATTPSGSRLSTPVNHYGLLRTLEELYHVPFLAGAIDPGNGDLLALIS